MNHYVAIVLWILINGAIAFRLQGAGFLIFRFLSPIYFWRFVTQDQII
jgi:hypothetical protein